MESSSSSGSSKRSKGFENIRHEVTCLVDECSSDLSQCREYHRRHKVCEFHSKTSKVSIGGQEQRFCQQCSRFHSLGEFDDGKRSCRKRLDSHNRRRRKPPSECLSNNSPTRFFPNQQGNNLVSFGTTQQLLPSALMDSSWAGPLKLENNVGGPYYRQDNNNNNENNNNNNNFAGLNHFKIDYPEPLFSNPCSGSGNSNGYDTTSTRVVDSDCALSLLSSSTTSETTRVTGLGYSLVPNMQYCEEPVSSSYDAHNYNNDHHCQGLFHDGPDGPSANGPSPTLSFKWE